MVDIRRLDIDSEKWHLFSLVGMDILILILLHSLQECKHSFVTLFTHLTGIYFNL